MFVLYMLCLFNFLHACSSRIKYKKKNGTMKTEMKSTIKREADLLLCVPGGSACAHGLIAIAEQLG